MYVNARHGRAWSLILLEKFLVIPMKMVVNKVNLI